MRAISPGCTAVFLVHQAFASGFPPIPEDLTIKQVASHPGVSISYKQTCICDINPSWAGYVHMPSGYLADVQGSDPYNLSTFFWYFRARNEPENAPTAIYLAGGPGQSSLFGAAEDGGPCYVLADSNSTEQNPWSWNEHVNMLYIDQPNTVGFSYDVLLNGTLDMLFLGGEESDTGIVPFEDYEDGTVPDANETFYYGTFPSQNQNCTANSTSTAARTLWHFMQAWVEFPEWKTSDRKISFWGNSYGGYWVPITAAFFQQQNVRISSGELKNSRVLELDTIGFTNGCTDMLYQSAYYPEMAYSNTYGLQVLSKEQYDEASSKFTRKRGCHNQILQCREAGNLYDPEQMNTNATANALCLEAELCTASVIDAYDAVSNRSHFDMAHFKPDPFPVPYVAGFFNQHWVQRTLGVPVNFTANSNALENAILDLGGDAVRVEGMKALEYLLNSQIKVGLIYGDRDYDCPWIGAEALALQANWTAPGKTGSEDFRDAGYEYIQTNSSYLGGVVRQAGPLSFSRVFDAGHDVSVYQPETSFRIFNRVMLNRDVATGKLPTSGLNSNYTSHGPSSSFQIKNKLPRPPLPTVECYLYNVAPSCTEDQYAALLNGTADIVDFTVVKPVGGDGALGGSSGF